MAEESKEPPAATSPQDKLQDKPQATPPSGATGAGPTAAGSTGPASAIPNRDRRREPPIIDARPGDVKEVSPAASAEAPKSGPAKDGPASASKASAPPESPAAKPETPKTSATPMSSPKISAPPPAQRPAGLGAMLMSGAAGAVIALVAGWGLLAARYYPASEVDTRMTTGIARGVAGLTSHVETANRKLEEQAARQASLIEEAGKRVSALDAQAKKLAGEIETVRQMAAKPAPAPQPVPAPVPAPAPAPTVDLGPIEAGLGDLEKRLALIEKALAAPKTEMRISDPDVKPPLSTEATPAAPAPAIIPPAIIADLSALAARLKAMESRPLPQPADLGPLQTRLQQLEQKLAPLAERLGPLEQKIAPLEAALGQSREALGGQAKTIEAGRERADAAALSVVTRALSDAVAVGAPYANVLKAASALGADANAAKVLEKFAARGVPSAAALAAQFAPLSASILENASKANPNASLTEKLAASAGKLVRIRAGEDSKDETLDALAVRTTAALRNGKLEEALALFEKMPAAARAPAKAWGDSLRERIEADRAAGTILNAALARLARP